MDEFLPEYDVSEHHKISVAASPEAVVQAARRVTPRDLPLTVVLMGIRAPWRWSPEAPAWRSIVQCRRSRPPSIRISQQDFCTAAADSHKQRV
jgi:hypothetical protein